MAVRLVNSSKTYGRKTDQNTVFNNLTLTVPQGSLYSLLGSSGCGKTTIISCLVGLNKLDSGQVFIFGSTKISNQLNRIGYMPQEVSLYKEFSVLETLTYFGRLTVIKNVYLRQRIKFLLHLLELPNADRRVDTLSGGQCRRLSLAVALLHEPKLLLLDEPTAGADSLIRERIWEHLKLLTTQQHITVLLTTHYIGEARRSDFVGIIRNGKLIAEKPPQSLLNELQVNSLEDAFVALCKSPNSFQDLDIQTQTNLKIKTPVLDKAEPIKRQPLYRITVLLQKNLKILRRSVWMLIFVLLVPSFSLFIDCVAFEHDAAGLNIGVVNLDVNSSDVCFDNNYVSSVCTTYQLSCKFLNEIPDNSLNLVYFNEREMAKAAVQTGDIWGYMMFPTNYSDALTSRALHIEDANWNNSVITVSLDQTNKLIYNEIITKLYEAFESFSRKVLEECGQDERNGRFSLQYSNPVVGTKGVQFLDYIAPGLAMSILYFFPLTVAIRMINERRQGIADRYMAMGIEKWEILVAYVLSEFIILLCQSLTVYIILYYGFSIGASIFTSPENVALTLALLILQGISALTFGLILGIVCNREEEAAMIIIATLFPNSIISGVLWPREGMAEWVQKISFVLPMTLPGEAIRSVMTRHWDFYYENVWEGFLVPIIYATINVFIIFCIIRKK